MADRFERVVASCLRALAGFLQAALPSVSAAKDGGLSGEGNARIVSDILEGVASIISRGGFFKAQLGSKSVMVCFSAQYSMAMHDLMRSVEARVSG
jgi:hypothetical protein